MTLFNSERLNRGFEAEAMIGGTYAARTFPDLYRRLRDVHIPRARAERRVEDDRRRALGPEPPRRKRSRS